MFNIDCGAAVPALHVRFMGESKPSTRSADSMRRRNARLNAEGYRRATYSLSPTSVEVVEGVKEKLKLSSREAALNAILEQIDRDMFLRQEFLAVTT